MAFVIAKPGFMKILIKLAKYVTLCVFPVSMILLISQELDVKIVLTY
jgi:hypothetical protein